MKRNNDFLIVGIDHGYGNIKTANTVTPMGITKLDAAPTFTKNTLYYDGSYYLIGEGHKEYLLDKWQDNDNYLFTLMGIAHELNREGITSADIHLAVGLPLTWVNRQREDFRKYMLQRESVDFKYEDRLFSVRIIGCSVFSQGYAAVVPYLRDMTGLNIILTKEYVHYLAVNSNELHLHGLWKKCSIVLADEPTGSSDSGNAEKVMNILSELNKIGKKVVMVTHDRKYQNLGNRQIDLKFWCIHKDVLLCRYNNRILLPVIPPLRQNDYHFLHQRFRLHRLTREVHRGHRR